jgi:hypothetical protein
MNHLRNIVRDLVERRLWPVAVALVAALVAVPVVLGGHGASAPTAAVPAAPVTGSAGGTSEKAEVTVDTSAPVRRERGGDVRDPFKAPAAPRSEATTPPATTPAPAVPTGGDAGTDATPATSAGSVASDATGSSSVGSADTTSSTPTSSGSDSGSTAPKTTTAKPKTPAKPKADDALDTYHVSLRIGVNGGEPKTLRDVARLSALPSVSDPFFVYLGVLETQKTHEKRAVFMVSSDAVPNGEGACHPTKQDCETVELTVDQTVYFDYTAPDGKVTQYELQLAGIHKTEVHSEAKAQAAIARHSDAGAELLRDAAVRNVRAAAGARSYRYLPGIGMLVRAKRAAEARAASDALALQAGGAAALLPRRRQPGLPVWHSPRRTPKR